MYLALIGDVVASKQISERSRFQSALLEELEALNEELDAFLVGKLMLLKGDEIQCLLAHPPAAIDVVVRLADRFFPVTFAWGLGFGPLTTAVDSDSSRMDGPCFHLARQSLEEGKKRAAWLRAGGGFGGRTEVVLGSLFDLMQALRERWTERQAQFVRAARHDLQKTVAANFDVSPSVVSESLKAASFSALRSGEQAAAALLEEIARDTEVDGESPE